MDINAQGQALIKEHEGFRLTVYPDSVGLPTVGWGHRVLPQDGLKMGDTIDQARATQFFADDCAVVQHALEHLLKVGVNQNQYSALASFAFNVGTGLRGLGGSTLLRLLNQGNYTAAANQFKFWDHAGGKEIDGLKTRRIAEATLFQTPITQN